MVPLRRTVAPLLALAPLVLTLLVLWGMMAGRGAAGREPAVAAGAGVLVVFLLTFGSLSLDLVGRLAAVALGAAALLVMGTLLRFYFPPEALAYLWNRREPLLMLAGIGMVTDLLHISGLFEHLAHRAVQVAGADPLRVTVQLCVLTYLLSLLLNNLATILVIVPLSVRVAEAMEMDPVPLAVGEVIASNLGGASTMVGDFPNMLIATQAHVGFVGFLVYLAPICLLQLVVLLVLLAPGQRAAGSRLPSLERVLARLGSRRLDRRAAGRGLAILAAMVVGFLVCGWLDLSPGVLALMAGHVALFAGGIPLRKLVAQLSVADLLFFVCLFLMVGAVSASGVLDGLGGTVAGLWQRRPIVGALAVAWGAALLTCVLSAGPTTALLLHVLAPAGGTRAIWWALSLGVCAGSSATLTGATAGPVTASLLEHSGHTLSFNRFARTGIPVMFLFLCISSAYLALLVS
jgi:Na+/H+ antiporter NhaD/arsenite permease-like protein